MEGKNEIFSKRICEGCNKTFVPQFCFQYACKECWENSDFVNYKRKAAPFFSIIIPAYNGEKTIKRCLKSIFSSTFKNFEVITIDDCSRDNTLKILKEFNVGIIKLMKNKGPSIARNIGAERASGKFLFFTDIDCVLDRNTLEKTYQLIQKNKMSVFGGTYNKLPADRSFASDFQAIFANFFETKKKEPDYIASHFLVIEKELFKKVGGFHRTPLIEDVELSHRLKKEGFKLKIYPQLTVKHIFGFTLYKSLRNAFRKSYGWVRTSLMMRDLTRDSGVASKELKFTLFGLACFLIGILLGFFNKFFFLLSLISFIAMLLINMNFFKFICEKKGCSYGIKAALYFMFLYSFFVGLGGSLSLLKYSFNKRSLKEY